MSIKNRSLNSPLKLAHFIFLLLFILTYQGCSIKHNNENILINNNYSNDKKKEKSTIEKSPKVTQLTKDSYHNRYIYEKAIGKSLSSAEKKAKKNLKDKIAKDIKKYLKNRLVHRVITEDEMLYIDKKIVKNIDSLSSEFKILESGKIDANSSLYKVVVGVNKKESAKKIKKEFLKYLVKVESSWHSLKDPSSFQRYIVAKKCYKDLLDVLNLYFLADYLSPYSDILKKRVEPTLSFLKNQANNAKKKIKLFIVKSNSPAVSIFNKKMKKGLQENGFKVVGKLEYDTVCITLKNNLKHTKEAQKYLFKGDIYMKFHKPFSSPFLIRKYRVKGQSKVSGKDALDKISDLFVEKIKKDLSF